MTTPAADTIVCVPSGEHTVTLADGDVPVLTMPVIPVIDLSASHGVDVTLDRLNEMANAYDPAVEIASLNFDHAFAGPSLGWCTRLWVQDSQLWAEYSNLQPEAVEGIRSGRYIRRSAEFVIQHRSTGGWYFTACALLGNARPAAPSLPPVTLFRPGFKVVSCCKEEETMTEVNPEPPPAADPEPSVAFAALLDDGRRQVAQLRQQNAQLRTGALLAELGSKVSPGMRKHLEPLLLSLLNQESDTKVRLAGQGGTEERPVVDVLMDVLRAAPSFDALQQGRLAEEDAPSGPLSPERLAELERKYRMGASWGYR